MMHDADARRANGIDARQIPELVSRHRCTDVTQTLHRPGEIYKQKDQAAVLAECIQADFS
jgi:hypothetical protein